MEEIALLQKPMTSLNIQSNENLEITVTKAGLTLLTDLGQVGPWKLGLFYCFIVLFIFYHLDNGS